MIRLTEKDGQGNWRLKGVPWENLYAGAVITEETRQKLYGALWKLVDYEDTGLSPEEVERVNDFELTSTARLLEKLSRERNKHRWIPVGERLPEDGVKVLVTLNGGLVITTRYSNNRWDLWADDEVIAWQPLPEPYKGGTT